MYEDIAAPTTEPHMPAAGVQAVTGQVAPGQFASEQLAAERLFAGAGWAETSVSDRMRVLKRARHALAGAAGELVDCLASLPGRTRPDSLAAEVLPLLEACRFLEQQAGQILGTRTLGRRGLPFWLAGLQSRVERVALGKILVIGPANYPLLLPGVQTLQALAAGNQVVWKPGRGGAQVARMFAGILHEAGLPDGLLRVTDESVEAVEAELQAAPDKVVFTGSASAGKAVARLAAERASPMVAELSGCDAVVVLASADYKRVAAALTFGMRLNGSATCMAPRRLFLVGEGFDGLLEALTESLARVPQVELDPVTRRKLEQYLDEAQRLGATIVGEPGGALLVLNGQPSMRIAQADIFAPVLTVLRVADLQALGKAYAVCEYALTVAVFGEEREALKAGETLCAGTLIVNDLIVPTADPRVPFGGRKASGYGVTRGAEGLLEMTAVKTVLVRRGKSLRNFEPTGAAHEELFTGVIGWQHKTGWRARLQGLKTMMRAAKVLGAKVPAAKVPAVKVPAARETR